MTIEAPLRRIEERLSEDLRRSEARTEQAISRLDQQLSALANSTIFLEKQIVRDVERLNNIVAGLQVTIDKLSVDVSDLKKQQAKSAHEASMALDITTAQSSQLAKISEELRPLQAHMNKIDGVIKVAGVIATAIGLIATLYEVFIRK
jgi:chromosome segregation ATPase